MSNYHEQTVLGSYGVLSGTVKILIMGSRNFYPIYVPLFGCQVSGVSVQLYRQRSWIHHS
jgi:hypothetical protein